MNAESKIPILFVFIVASLLFVWASCVDLADFSKAPTVQSGGEIPSDIGTNQSAPVSIKKEGTHDK